MAFGGSRYMIENPEGPSWIEGLTTQANKIAEAYSQRRLGELKRKQEIEDTTNLIKMKEESAGRLGEIERKNKLADELDLMRQKSAIDTQAKEQLLGRILGTGQSVQGQEQGMQGMQGMQGNVSGFRPKGFNYEGINFERNPSEEERNIDLQRKIKENEALRMPTQGEELNALYASRANQAEKEFERMNDELSHLGLGASIMQAKGPFGIGVPNFMKTNDAQSYEQAKRNFLNAVLRKESGAVISPTEFEEGNLQYFNQPGDKEDVRRQKKENRATVIRNLIKSSGKAYLNEGQQNTPVFGGTKVDLKSKYGLE